MKPGKFKVVGQTIEFEAGQIQSSRGHGNKTGDGKDDDDDEKALLATGSKSAYGRGESLKSDW